jgi:serine/threonine protein kinase
VKEATINNKLMGADPELIRLVEGCLKFNPGERLTIKQCLEFPIFDAIRKQKLEKPSST